MKRLFLLLFICLTGLPGMYAQSSFRMIMGEEGKLYFIPRARPSAQTLEVPEFSFSVENLYIPTAIPRSDLQSFNPAETQSLPVTELPMNMQVLSSAYKPFFNIYAPLYIRTNPMAFDYFEGYGYHLNPNVSFQVSGFQGTWPGNGSLNTVSGGVAWQNEKIGFWGGGFAGRYATPYEISPGVMAGVQGGVNFQATEWLKLKTWGQYTFYDEKGKDNMFLYLNHQMPQIAVGGAMEFKVNENFGFGIGIQRNYNPMRGKWENNQMFYPTYRNGNKSISIGVSP